MAISFSHFGYFGFSKNICTPLLLHIQFWNFSFSYTTVLLSKLKIIALHNDDIKHRMSYSGVVMQANRLTEIRHQQVWLFTRLHVLRLQNENFALGNASTFSQVLCQSATTTSALAASKSIALLIVDACVNS